MGRDLNDHKGPPMRRSAESSDRIILLFYQILSKLIPLCHVSGGDTKAICPLEGRKEKR